MTEVNEAEFEVDPEPTIDSEQSVIITNPTIDYPTDTGPLSSLTPAQRTRVGALNMAKPLITEKGPLGGTKAADIGDLIRLATWILDGDDEPLYPYAMDETVVLGPDVTLGGLGDFITWKGMRYLKEEEE